MSGMRAGVPAGAAIVSAEASSRRSRARRAVARKVGRYSPGGRLTDAEIVESYADFVMRAVLAPTALRKWVRQQERQSR